MAALTMDPNHVYRDFVIDGVPASGAWDPRKVEIRRLLSEHMAAIIALIAGQGGDIDLPNLLIRYTVTGGTADAIEATPNLPAPSGPGLALFSIAIQQPNTGPVTINGKPLLTNTGEPVPAGYLGAGMTLLFLDDGASFKMLSYGDAEAIQATVEDLLVQAEAARDAAQAAASSVVPNIFSTKAVAQAYTPAVAPDFIQTAGHTLSGDGGGAIYKRVAAEPIHAGKFSITLSDGVTIAWYEVSEVHPRPDTQSGMVLRAAIADSATSELSGATTLGTDEIIAEGRAIRFTGAASIYGRKVYKFDPSKVYRVTFRVKMVTDQVPNRIYAGIRCFLSDFSLVTSATAQRYCAAYDEQPVVADGEMVYSGLIGGKGGGNNVFAPDTVYFRAYAVLLAGSTTSVIDLIDFDIADVTESASGVSTFSVGVPAILKGRGPWKLSKFARGAGLGIEARDSAALTNALASGEKAIEIDPVEFQLALGQYVVPVNTYLKGSGRASTLKMNDPAQAVALLRIASGVHLKGFNLRGPQDTVSSVLTGQTGIDTGDTGSDVEGVTFTDLDIQGFRWYGVHAHRMKRFRSYGVHQRNLGRAGWIMVGGSDCQHRGDTVRNVGPGSGGVAPLINAYGFNYGNDGAAAGFPVPKDIYFVNCGVEDIPSWTAFDSHGSDNFNVINCWTRRVCNPIYLGPSSGTNNDGAFNWSVIGGNFTADGITYRRAGIIAAWKDGSLGGTGGRIIGPTIDGYGLNPALAAAYSSLTLEGAIHLAYQAGIVIDAPVITNFNQVGVLFRRQVEDVILKNHVIRNGVATLSRADAIVVAETQNIAVTIDKGYIRRVGGTALRGVVSEGTGLTSIYGARVHKQDFVGVTMPYVQTAPFHPDSTAP